MVGVEWGEDPHVKKGQIFNRSWLLNLLGLYFLI